MGFVRMTGTDPVPRRAIVRMKWVEALTNEPVLANYVAGSALKTIHLNDINTPAVGAITQPYSHDYYQQIFAKYRVIACKWRVEVRQIEGSNPIRGLCRVHRIPLSTFTMDTVGMEPGVITKENAGSLTLKTPLVFAGRTRIPQVFGQTSAQYKYDEDKVGTVGTFGGGAPADLAYLEVLVASAEVATLEIRTQLTYIVEMWDPIALPFS